MDLASPQAAGASGDPSPSRPRPPGRLAAPSVSPARAEARDVLAGKSLPPVELLSLAKRLKGEQAFTQARRVLARALADASLSLDKSLALRVAQECALCTYKDTDLPADDRLDLALGILERADDLALTENQETLGLAGAISKRKWEVDPKRQALERSLHYYLRGYEQGTAGDQGYTGINAAFVHDLLAQLEIDEARQSGSAAPTAAERRAAARAIREAIVTQVPPLAEQETQKWLAGQWWFYSTVAEAWFGLGRFDDAVKWLRDGLERAAPVPEWEIQSTLQQLARIGILQDGDAADLDEQPAWRALDSVFGKDAAAVRGAFLGKVGLALSGGGFRAALFHIGVLAKLAEHDVLRHVEVLSCVSGGSIVGAHYYLEVRKLLQEKPDADVTREDYVEIVRRVERDFVAGVQRNVRTRVVASLWTNLKMTFVPEYSRTLRVGELYEKEIFSRVADGGGDDERWIDELNVVPKGEAPTFTPKLNNWRRSAKVPILILNATTLNTGHNWQFTTAWMGEPPGSIDTDVDGNEQLRRMYYSEAPAAHRRMRLGHAVAASSCVPGLFEPLVLSGLYPGRVVRLVDGGVCDNQGIGGLLEQGCTVMLVSDGSGQSASQPNPSAGLLGVPMRSNSILGKRVREGQYRDVRARRRASVLRSLMFVHLKADLDVDPVDWIDCPDPYDASDDARPPARRGPLARYGIAKDVQALLAGVRTDLDSFSDVEARALMTSAYRQTEYQLRSSPDLEGFPAPPAPEPWGFLQVEAGMKDAGAKKVYLERLLGTSGGLAFKVWKQSTPLRVFALALLAAAVAAIVWVLWRPPATLQRVYALTLGEVLRGALLLAATMVLTALATYLVGKTVVRLVRWRDTFTRVVTGVALSVAATLVARLHLHVFDRWFLRLGSIERFERQ
jgi:predicted acylesterase/phospholipase RssA